MMTTTGPADDAAPVSNLTVSVSIEADIYPELYAQVAAKGKGSRSEFIRALAVEALANRRTVAAAHAAQAARARELQAVAQAQALTQQPLLPPPPPAVASDGG